MSRILIVEDEEHLARGLQFNLQAEDHDVEVAGSGEEALDLLLKQKRYFDVMVLDIMLPGKDGFTVARELRAARVFIPILMLTARGRSEDILQGFEAGTDDYLPKPFDLAILTARLNSLTRRGKWIQSQEAIPEPEILRFDGKYLDLDALELHCGEETHHLTLMEAQLLRYLIRSAGRPVSRKAILEEVWGLHEDTDTRAIDNFIVRLRRYIEADPSRPKHLQTVRGIGYRFMPSPES